MSILSIIIALFIGIFIGRYFVINKNDIQILSDMERVDNFINKAENKSRIISPTKLKQQKDFENAMKEDF